MEFFRHLYKVYRPEFEQPGQEFPEEAKGKPVATRLPNADEVADDVRADLKNDDDAKQVGVAIAQATYALSGASWYIMMIALFIVYWVYSMDNLTTLTYLIYSMSLNASQKPSYLTAVAIEGVIAGVAKLIIAKLADIYGRFTAGLVTMFFYCLGFLILAVSHTNKAQTAGIALQAVGNSGLLMVIWIILADFLSSRMRAFGIAFVTLPFLITFATAPKISTKVELTNWRWGYGMFCILVPVTMAPILGILYYLESKAKRSGLVPKHPYLRNGFLHGLKEFLLDADIGGMILILAGFIFLLLALTQGGTEGWSTHWIIALLAVGGFLILFIPIYEYFISPRPFIRQRWLNSSVVLAIFIALFDFMSFNISFQMLFYWRSIALNLLSTDPKTLYFTYTDSVCLTVFGVLAGAIIWATRRYKPVVIVGAIIRLVAYGLMIRYRHAGTTMVQAVWPQVLLGMGGGFVGDVITISSQVTVRHQDVAMVTAVVMLFQSIGQAIGTAIFSAIIDDQFPKKLMQYQGIPKEQAAMDALTFTTASTYGLQNRDSPQTQTQIRAWNDAAERALWAGIVFSAMVLICSLFLKDYVLTRSQNVVSAELPEKSPWAMGSDRTYENAIEGGEMRNGDLDGYKKNDLDSTYGSRANGAPYAPESNANGLAYPNGEISGIDNNLGNTQGSNAANAPGFGSNAKQDAAYGAGSFNVAGNVNSSDANAGNAVGNNTDGMAYSSRPVTEVIPQYGQHVTNTA
ncbi:hypothetical protein MYAM1_001212 [Malassezia yamatoensis]|uniref:Major facilitator superfamily (MFS) profile domain-containing protein n=1 Tax=Malassezia yamatoensis TaxID=253288 RepID=A0AAJ5YXX8_9BASI|nr:hypothetical protein MYAM1_001212 [Malassezia yamatoensis]